MQLDPIIGQNRSQTNLRVFLSHVQKLLARTLQSVYVGTRCSLAEQTAVPSSCRFRHVDGCVYIYLSSQSSSYALCGKSLMPLHILLTLDYQAITRMVTRLAPHNMTAAARIPMVPGTLPGQVDYPTKTRSETCLPRYWRVYWHSNDKNRACFILH